MDESVAVNITIAKRPVHQPYRTGIAELCRYTLELQYARTGGREEAASEIADYVNQLAIDLLLELGDDRRATPTQRSDGN